MIQNKRQYEITRSKLRDLQIDLAALDLPSDLHPRQILARKNSLGILIEELEQEMVEYVGGSQRCRSTQPTSLPVPGAASVDPGVTADFF
jgi:hypothetical protein